MPQIDGAGEPDDNQESVEPNSSEPYVTLQTPRNVESAGGVSHSSSAASLATNASVQQPQTDSNLNSAKVNGSTASIASVAGDSTASGSLPQQKSKIFDGAISALKTYINPTYTDYDADFQKLFASQIENPPLDRLLYFCQAGVNKDLLYSGKVYVSQHYICFNSSVFGGLNIVVPFSDVVTIKKEKVLRTFSTAIEVFFFIYCGFWFFMCLP